jgi:transposase
MLTVFLSVRGAVLINLLPPQAKFDSTYFCQNLIGPLTHILHSGRKTRSGRPRVHFDNATLHRSVRSENCFEAWGFRHAPQPPYSSDISPCDFFLFGDLKLKMKLKGEEFETLEELQERIEELLGLINSELMERVYEHWIERLNQFIDTKGDYV